MGAMDLLATARLVLGLACAYAHWGAIQLCRKVAGRYHPLGWCPEEVRLVSPLQLLPGGHSGRGRDAASVLEKLIMLGRVDPGNAPLNVTQKILQSLVNSNPVSALELSCVPAKTFETPGFRDSWWIALNPGSQPKHPKANIVIMYLHGGSFRAGHPLLYSSTFQVWLQRLADLGIQTKIFSVGYPLAPDNRFPLPVQGVAEAYQWLVTQQGGSNNIVIAGDSAGGNLVLTSMEYMHNPAARASVPPATPTAPPAATFQPPLAAIVISPATDFRLSAPSNRAPSTPYDMFTPNTFPSVRKQYLPKGWNAELLNNTLLSPVCIEDFGDLVQTDLLVIAGETEMLLGDINEFVEKVKNRRGNLAVSYHVEKQQPHVYCLLGIKELCDRGADVIVPFIAKVLGIKA